MPGTQQEVMPNLEAQIKAGELPGSWPAARDKWGSWSNKLETVLLVSIPAKQHRSADRVLPGRDDVYILPLSMCESGTQLNERDTGWYYSNTHIRACFVLRAPDRDFAVPAAHGPVWVKITSSHDARGNMADVHMTALANDERVADEVSGGFPPNVSQCTALIARPPTENFVPLHRLLEKEHGSKRHWLDNIARFKVAEMIAGMEGIKIQLLHAYTMAFVYTSNELANGICRAGGIAAEPTENGMYKLKVSLGSPL